MNDIGHYCNQRIQIQKKQRTIGRGAGVGHIERVVKGDWREVNLR